jgi:chromosome segregation ATPase
MSDSRTALQQQLQAELDASDQYNRILREHQQEWFAKIERIEAQNSELRAALSLLVVCIQALEQDFGTQYPALSEAYMRARAALASPESAG